MLISKEKQEFSQISSAQEATMQPLPSERSAEIASRRHVTERRPPLYPPQVRLIIYRLSLYDFDSF